MEKICAIAGDALPVPHSFPVGNKTKSPAPSSEHFTFKTPCFILYAANASCFFYFFKLKFKIKAFIVLFDVN